MVATTWAQFLVGNLDAKENTTSLCSLGDPHTISHHILKCGRNCGNCLLHPNKLVQRKIYWLLLIFPMLSILALVVGIFYAIVNNSYYLHILITDTEEEGPWFGEKFRLMVSHSHSSHCVSSNLYRDIKQCEQNNENYWESMLRFLGNGMHGGRIGISKM